MLQSAAYRIAKRAYLVKNLQEFYSELHGIVEELMYAKNFYIALYDESRQILSFPYFVDEFDPPPEPRVMKKGLTEYIIRTGRPLLATRETFNELKQRGEIELMGAEALDWLGVPLKSGEKTFGVLAVQSYSRSIRYGRKDKEVLTFVSEQIATVLDHRRAEEALQVRTEQLQVISQAMMTYLETEDWQEASTMLLQGGLGQTASEFGFVGVLMEGSVLRILSCGGTQWDTSISADSDSGVLEFADFDNLFGQVLTIGRAVLCNDLNGSDCRNLPLGLPVFRHFLGVPILRGHQVIGMIGVANRHGGYTFVEQTRLEVLAQMAGVLHRVMLDATKRKHAEEEKRKLEEQLLQAQKMQALGQLAGGVAHDFNNILMALTGYSELLLLQLQTNDPSFRYATEMQKAAAQGAALTRQLLAFSRKQVLELKILDLRHVIKNVENMLRRLLRENIELEIAMPEELGCVKADRGQIEQVLMNLVVNACDAMPQGGRLVIETANVKLDQEYARHHLDLTPGEYVMLAVGDNGCGMDEATKSRIFEPFFTTKDTGKGTGLGLSTVYGIVQQCGGHISVCSQPGQGTTFNIYFPRMDEPSPAITPSRAAGISQPYGKETILLVDDNESVRVAVGSLLRMHGYQVLEAYDGPTAMEVSRNHREKIHLMITDVVMPLMSGCELAEQLMLERAGMKVIYMSGYTEDALHGDSLLEPETTFLSKPASSEMLFAKIRNVLD